MKKLLLDIFLPWLQLRRARRSLAKCEADLASRCANYDDSFDRVRQLERQLEYKKQELLDARRYKDVLRGRLDEFAVGEINKSPLPVEAHKVPGGGVAVKTPFGVFSHNSCPDPFRKLPPIDADRPSTWPAT